MEIKVLASGSTGNCTYISDGKSSLLLDAGISVAKIREGTDFRLSSVAAALITHRHKDHSKAVPELLKAGVRVIAPPDVFPAEKLPHWAAAITDGIYMFYAGSFFIRAFPLHHDVPCYGFYIRSLESNENLVYITDTYYTDFTLPNLHYLLCECNYDPAALEANVESERLPQQFKTRLVKSHMSIDSVLGLLAANDRTFMKRIYLMHLSDNNSKADEFKRRVQAAAGCEVYVV